MSNNKLELLKYPIGKFVFPESATTEQVNIWISLLEEFPERLKLLVNNLSNNQLDTPYRPDGWTVRQTIHHISDSHQQSFTRIKWALTEDKPIIKAYYEERWAELTDSKTAPIEMSLEHLRATHLKMVYLLRRLSEADLNRTFIHPETKNEISLKRHIGLYAWHGNHHYAQIEHLLIRNRWL